MVQMPYAYDKNPQRPMGRLRLWLGVALLVASLAALGYLFWLFATQKPVEDDPAQHAPSWMR